METTKLKFTMIGHSLILLQRYLAMKGNRNFPLKLQPGMQIALKKCESVYNDMVHEIWAFECQEFEVVARTWNGTRISWNRGDWGSLWWLSTWKTQQRCISKGNNMEIFFPSRASAFRCVCGQSQLCKYWYGKAVDYGILTTTKWSWKKKEHDHGGDGKVHEVAEKSSEHWCLPLKQVVLPKI